MWALGAAFSRLWRTEWQRRQRAMELRARVQLHALAMDLPPAPMPPTDTITLATYCF